jgi:hypothetical protein
MLLNLFLLYSEGSSSCKKERQMEEILFKERGDSNSKYKVI